MLGGRSRIDLTMAETAFRAPCDRCKAPVAVKINVSGKAYYTCDDCGFKGQDTWQKSSDAYVTKHSTPASSPAPIHNPPAPAPAVRKAAGTVLG